MFGSEPRMRRPLLLALVFGAFLVIIGITATAQAVMVSLHFSTDALNTIVASDSATVRAVLNDSLHLADLDPAIGPTAQSRTVLNGELAALAGPKEIVRVELRRLDGTIIAASDSTLAGAVIVPTGASAEAALGQANVALVPGSDAGAGPGALPSTTVLREFLPISTGGQVRAVVGVWRDARPDPRAPRRCPPRRRHRDALGGDRRRADPVPHLPRRPGPADEADRRPRRVDAPRPVDRNAQSRGARRVPRDRDGARPAGRNAARRRACRSRQFPAAQRQPRPSSGRRGAPRGGPRARAASSAGGDDGPLRPGRVPRGGSGRSGRRARAGDRPAQGRADRSAACSSSRRNGCRSPSAPGSARIPSMDRR